MDMWMNDEAGYSGVNLVVIFKDLEDRFIGGDDIGLEEEE